MSATHIDDLTARRLYIQEVRGFERGLPAVSPDAGWILIQDSVDDLLKLSVDTGAFMIIAGPGGFGTLDLAYDGPAGLGAGRTITADSGAVVINNAAANNNNVLELNKTPAAAQTGSLLTGTWTVAATAAATGMVLTVTGAGAAATDPSAASFCARFDYRSVNGTAAGNGIVNIEVGAARALTAGGVNPITGLELDLNTNLTANDNIVRCAVFQTAASTAADAASTVAAGVLTPGSGVLIVFSRQTAGRIVDILASNTGAAGSLVAVRYPVATVGAAAFTGVNLDFSTNFTPGAFTNIGVDLLMGASSVAGSRGLRITSTQTGAASALLELLPTPGAASGVRGLVIAMTGNAQGNCIDLTDNALIADQTASLRVLHNPADTASTDRLALSVSYQPVLAPAVGRNDGAVGSALALIERIPTWNPGAAAVLTLQRAVLRLENQPVAANDANATITDTTPILQIIHGPTRGALATYNDTSIGLDIAMTPAAGSVVGAGHTGIRVQMGAVAAGLTNAAITAAVAVANEETVPVLVLNGIQFYVGQLTPPVVAAPDGSFFFNTGGTAAGNTLIYHREAGVWVALTT